MASMENGRKRRLIAAAAAAAGTVAAIGAFVFAGTANAEIRAAAHPVADAAGAGRAPKPTIVLEHGAFADGSSWDGVIADLRRAGYPVVAAANPLRGPAFDAAALRGLIAHIK